MADLRIDQLPPAPGSIDPADYVPVSSVNGTLGVTYRRPMSEVEALFAPPTPPGGSGLGNGGWELHQSWTQSIDGNLTGPWNILGLAGVSDLRILGIGITRSSSVAFALELSADNGSTFFTTSGDYITFSTAAASNATGLPLHPAATAIRSFASELTGMEGYPAMTSPNASQGQPSSMFIQNGSPLNAARLTFGAASLTTGHLKVFKRRLPRYRLPTYTLAAANALTGIQDGEAVIITDATSPVKGTAITGGGSTATVAFRLSGAWIAA